jgi:3-oxoacyl-[acyl-carrier protein] reductase
MQIIGVLPRRESSRVREESTLDVENRIVVVTGAASGIGAACAEALSKLGAELVLVDRAEAAHTNDRLAGPSTIAQLDVTDVAAVQRLFLQLASDGRDLAVVVNAAGIVTGGEPWPASDLHRVRDVLQVNAGGTAITTTLAARYPVAGERVVINLASAAAIRPLPPDPAYAMSKAGVLAFTKSAAMNSVGLRVNAVLPGVVDTPMLATTGTGGVADWLAPRMSGPLLSSGQVADAVVELVVGDHNGVAWSLEVDLDGSARVVAV